MKIESATFTAIEFPNVTPSNQVNAVFSLDAEAEHAQKRLNRKRKKTTSTPVNDNLQTGSDLQQHKVDIIV